MAGMGAKLLKLTKLARVVPFLGTFIGLGFTAAEAYSMAQKYVAGEEILPSDMAKMGAAAGSMIPGIGTGIALADIGAEATGGYEALDKALGKNALEGATTPEMPAMPVARGGGGGLGMMGGGASSAMQHSMTAAPFDGAQGQDVVLNSSVKLNIPQLIASYMERTATFATGKA